MRVSMDCKATVNIGEYSRGGKTRGDNHAADHDMGCEEKHTPFGVVNEDSGHLHLSFGSSAKTSDFIFELSHTVYEKVISLTKQAIQAVESSLEGNPFYQIGIS